MPRLQRDPSVVWLILPTETPPLEVKRYSFTFEYRPSYLYANLNVDAVTLETAMAYVYEMVNELRRSEVKKLLCVRNTTDVLPRKDYELLFKLCVSRLPGDVKFALVDRSSQSEIIRTGIDKEQTNGHPLIGGFKSIGEAESWLLDG